MSIWLIGGAAYATTVACALAMCRVASPAQRDSDTAGCQAECGLVGTIAGAPPPPSPAASSPTGKLRRNSRSVPAVARPR
jgi:hypothetical protein